MATILSNHEETVQTLSISEVRHRLSDLCHSVHQAGEWVVIERHGKPLAALVPAELLPLLVLLEDLVDRQDAEAELAALDAGAEHLVSAADMRRRLAQVPES